MFYSHTQARAKLPKKRRRIMPVEHLPRSLAVRSNPNQSLHHPASRAPATLAPANLSSPALSGSNFAYFAPDGHQQPQQQQQLIGLNSSALATNPHSSLYKAAGTGTTLVPRGATLDPHHSRARINLSNKDLLPESSPSPGAPGGRSVAASSRPAAAAANPSQSQSRESETANRADDVNVSNDLISVIPVKLQSDSSWPTTTTTTAETKPGKSESSPAHTKLAVNLDASARIKDDADCRLVAPGKESVEPQAKPQLDQPAQSAADSCRQCLDRLSALEDLGEPSAAAGQQLLYSAKEKTTTTTTTTPTGGGKQSNSNSSQAFPASASGWKRTCASRCLCSPSSGSCLSTGCCQRDSCARQRPGRGEHHSSSSSRPTRTTSSACLDCDTLGSSPTSSDLEEQQQQNQPDNGSAGKQHAHSKHATRRRQHHQQRQPPTTTEEPVVDCVLCLESSSSRKDSSDKSTIL